MSALVSGCECPKKLCGTFVAPGLHPRNKKSFTGNTWHLVCHKCSTEFDLPESDLIFESVSEQWLQEYPRD